MEKDWVWENLTKLYSERYLYVHHFFLHTQPVPATKSDISSDSVRETHAVAEAQQEKNSRLKEAFGISEFFVEGSSLDPNRKAKEELARAAAEKAKGSSSQAGGEAGGKKYGWVHTPSPSPEPSPKKEKKDKKKKKKRSRDR